MSDRKPSEAREKDLLLAIHRIQSGRANSKATRLNFTTVAAEAGVTPALIHNHYPKVADKIRGLIGKSMRQVRDATRDELKEEREVSRALRVERDELKLRVAKLASINEVLLNDNQVLRAQMADPKIVDFQLRTPKKVR